MGPSYALSTTPADTSLATAPQWLLDFATGNLPQQGYANAPFGTADVESPSIDVFQAASVLDLEIDPGVPAGERNDRALRLFGSHFGRREEPEEIWKKGVAWNARNRQPMTEKELRDIFEYVRKKEAAKAHLGGKQQAPWPVLNNTAYHGLAGEIVRTIEPQTEADPAAILAQFLVCFGNVVGRSPFSVAEATKHHTNLYIVVVGKTSKGRKGTGEGWVRNVFLNIDEHWTTDRVGSGLSSGEGLISRFGVPKALKKPEELEKPDRRLLVRAMEFAATLRVIKREGNTLTDIIKEAWDTGDMETMTKNMPTRARDAHFSIIGHITLEELKATLDRVEVFSGFSNRFLWICSQRSKLLPHGGKTAHLKAYIDRLADVVTFAKNVEEIKRDPEARDLWAEIYTELATEHGGFFGAVTSRGEAQVLRLSMIYALLDKSDIVRPEHLRAARALWQYAEDSALYIFGHSTGKTLADKLLNAIRSGPKTTTDLHALTGRHVTSEEMQGTLERLATDGLIKMREVAGGGRPAHEWFAM